MRVANGAPGRPRRTIERSNAQRHAGNCAHRGHDLALAVATDGRALLVVETADAYGAWERPSAAESFVRTPLPDVGFAQQVAVPLGSSGGAAIVTRGDGVNATLRAPGGRFGKLRRLDADRTATAFGNLSDRPSLIDFAPASVHVAIGAGGDAVVSWIEPGGFRRATMAGVARGTLAAGFAAPATLGTPCRDVRDATPLTLPGCIPWSRVASDASWSSWIRASPTRRARRSP